ncbi:lysylphosphatidylglycerol synthase transmembrane domain-containing protein [Candidatus Latescibacterota bacterium]
MHTGKNTTTNSVSVILRIVSSRLFKATVSLGLLGYIVYRFDSTKIIRNMLAADPFFLLSAVLVFITSGVLGAVQWGILLRFHGVYSRFKSTVARYFMGLFFNYIMPGFVGGDIVRVYKTSMDSGQPAQSFSSTLADRMIGLLVLVLFSLGAYIFMPGGTAERALPVGVFMLIVLCGFCAVFTFKPLGILVNRWFGRFIPQSIGEKLTAVYFEMHRLTRSPSTLALIFLMSCTIQITRIGVHFLCGHAVGIELNFAYFALFVPLIEIVASLPISFGGFGVRETMAFVLFSTVGVEQATVLSYSLLATSAGLAGALPGGAAFVMGIGDKKVK